MAVETEVTADTVRRRKRRAAWLAGLIPALIGAALLGGWLFRHQDDQTAWTADIVFPKLTDQASHHHGVTIPLKRRMAYTGQGGPEDAGAWIEEHAGSFAQAPESGGQKIDGFANASFTLPMGGVDVPGVRFGHFSGGGGAGGGGGGGDGGSVTLTCSDSAAVLAKLKELQPCAKTGEPSSTGVVTAPGSVVTTVTVDPVPGGPSNPSQPEGGPQPTTPVSAVPEPANWAMMIAGFLMVGGVIRSRNARRKEYLSSRAA